VAERQYLIFWLVEKFPVLTMTSGIAGLLFLVEWLGPDGGPPPIARPMSQIWWHLPAYWVATWVAFVGFGAVRKLTHKE
jgi:hypothetical protein